MYVLVSLRMYVIKYMFTCTYLSAALTHMYDFISYIAYIRSSSILCAFAEPSLYRTRRTGLEGSPGSIGKSYVCYMYIARSPSGQ